MRKIKLVGISVLAIGAFCFGKVVGASDKVQEKYPEMMAGKKHLEQAKENLKEAMHDYNGHRVNAIEHIDKAIKEIEEGIASEK